jgi:serine/threonine protein kinase/tetratricopeptide (TPR) repeat protein
METTLSHYTILEELGRGGMGIVYKARDDRLDRIVALKVLSGELAADPKARERFLKEARLASAIQHPRICTIHEIDETEDGQLFISMDYYEGETLQQKIYNGILSLESLLDIAIQIAEGISAAHKKGIIHRDIKPGNVIITPEGEVKILDFGLAKLNEKYISTQTSRVLGSVSYISPEQAQGKKVDLMTDIWSFGVVLYEMATGILPFGHESEAAIIYSILDKSPVPPSEINEVLPYQLESLMYQCLRKGKEERYQTMDEVHQELLTIRKGLNRKTGTSETSITVNKRAERRLATILVTEIASFPKLVKTHPEDADTLLARCFELFESIARRYGGSITGITDRNVTIAFGIHGKGENAPVQALNAAISMHQAENELIDRDSRKVPIMLKTGINTGTVIVKQLGDKDEEKFSIIGEPAVFAHALMESARADSILVGPVTYRRTRQLFDFAPEKYFSSVSTDEVVEVFELRSREIKDIRKTVPVDPLIRSDMVGREQEIDKLHYYLMRLIQGEGYIINVIGEAGIGKSRLLAEFRNKEAINRVKVLEGRGLASGENLSFHPLIEMTRSLSEIRDTDDEAAAIAKLRSTVVQICGDESIEVFPFIATFMGMKLTGEEAERIKGLEGEGLEKIILKNLRTLTKMASDRQPLMLIIEDLHWADQSSLRVLRSLYSLAALQPILFINVFRPDYPESSDQLRDDIRDRHEKQYEEMILKPLDNTHAELLIKNLLHIKAIPSRIKTLIQNRTEGNPLFLEEVIRHLIDQEVIVREEDRFRISEKINTAIIPESIHDVLMARIDKLAEEERSIIKMSAVIGRHFYRKILLEISDDPPRVDAILERLVRLQLIRKSNRKGEIEFLFKHALIQHAAYASTLIRQRNTLHLKVAEAIEKVFAVRLHEFYGVLAFHYSQGEAWDKAEHYLIRAGEQAFSSSASTEALHYFREALQVYLEKQGAEADPEKVAELNKYIGYAHFNSGHFIETYQYLEKVLYYHGIRIPKNPILLFTKIGVGLLTLMYRLQFPKYLGRHEHTERDREIEELILKRCYAMSITESMQMVKELMVHLPRLTRFHGMGIASIAMISFIFSVISVSTGRRILDICFERLDRDNKKDVVSVYSVDAYQKLIEGNWQPDVYSEEFFNWACQVGDFYNMVTYLGMQIQIYLERGDLFTREIHQKLAEVSETYDYEYGRLAKYSHGALILLKIRLYDQAVTYATEGIEFMKNTLGNKPGRLMIYTMKIRALIILGKLSEAEDTLIEANDFARSERLAPYFHSFLLTANLFFNVRKLELALKEKDRHLQRALKKEIRKTARLSLKVIRKAAYEKVENYRLFGTYYWIIQRQGKALKWWDKALRTAEKLGAKIELANTLEEVAERLSQPGSKQTTFKGESPEIFKQRAEALIKEIGIA